MASVSTPTPAFPQQPASAETPLAILATAAAEQVAETRAPAATTGPAFARLIAFAAAQVAAAAIEAIQNRLATRRTRYVRKLEMLKARQRMRMKIFIILDLRAWRASLQAEEEAKLPRKYKRSGKARQTTRKKAKVARKDSA